MSRSGYGEDCEQWDLIRWRGAVASAIRGKRGQAFLREMLAALDAMPEKRLIGHTLECDGDVCALGSVGRARGIAMSELDPEDRRNVAHVFGIAPAMAAEIVFENDEGCGYWHLEDWEERWHRMRAWVVSNLKEV